MAVVILQDGVPLDKKGRKSWIYVARVLADGTIKIGVSGGIQDRLATIRYERRSKIQLLGVMPGTLSNERLIHRKLSASRFDHEYYFDTPEVQAFIRDYITPAPRFGLEIKVSEKERELRPRPLSSRQPNTDNISRYIDRILAADGGQREIMTSRLILRVYHMSRRDCWPDFVRLFRERLSVDLQRSAKTYPCAQTRTIFHADGSSVSVNRAVRA